MATPREKFQTLLRKLFQFDCAELDFGIYRIMNQKRDVINKFIEKDLLDGVAVELTTGALAQESGLAQQLAEVSAQIKENFGDEALDAEGNLAKEYQTTPRGKQYLELRERASSARSSTELETEIFNHLYAFFSRYYDEGDFMSLRRYSKRDKYAIPYNGEEVHLHWANADQYYIKTGENFTDYSYKHGCWTVSFKLRNANVEQNNVKGVKRFFVPRVDDVDVDKKLCIVSIPFEYRPLTSEEETRKLTQDKMLDEAYAKILAVVKSNNDALAAMVHEKRKDSDGNTVTLLEHHLMTYTRRNSTDFFIHKDLKGFLERELDFYLKNEVLNIDELEASGEARSPRWFQMMKAIKAIGRKIIAFLAQIEDFQKRIFEKKKFIVEVNYCIALDLVPEELFPEIIKNKAQIDEWKAIYPDLEQEKIKLPIVRNNSKLVIDTRYFNKTFVDSLLQNQRIGDECGLLVYSENLQALNLFLVKYREKVKCIYIDPPFNLGENPDYLYKVDYKDSSWLSLLNDRIAIAKMLLHDDGSIFVRCNHDGNMILRLMLNSIFGSSNYRNEIILRRAEETKGDLNKQFAGVKSITVNYDNIYWYSKRPDTRFGRFLKPLTAEQGEAHWHSFWKAEDRPRMRYNLLGIDLRTHYGQWMWEINRATKAKENYEEYEKISKKTGESLEDYWRRTGEKLEFIKRDGNGFSSIKYWISPREFVMADNNWLDIKGYSNNWGFKTENSEIVLKRIIESLTKEGDLICDFFVGSGTTAACSQKMNRKWICVEMGEHFYSVILPRMKQVLYGEHSGISKSVDWQGGGFFKYVVLESYEDALDNISFQSPDKQDMFRLDDYVLSYMLGFETRQSETLLNVAKLDTPFDYKLKRHGKDKALPVDLPETFNYLIGLHVDSRRVLENKGNRYLVYRGKAEDRQTVIIWRTTSGWDKKEFEQDRDFVLKEKLTDGAEDVFVNTDSFISGARSLDPVFKHRMFNEE
jgi:adenine-specific DNA-methyltransferase